MDELELQLRAWLRGNDPAKRARAADLALKLGRTDVLVRARSWFEPHGEEGGTGGHSEIGGGPAGRFVADASILEHAAPKVRRLLAGEPTGAIVLGGGARHSVVDVPTERRLGAEWRDSLTSLRILGAPRQAQLDKLCELPKLRTLELDVAPDSRVAPLAACKALRTLVLMLPEGVPPTFFEELTLLTNLERLVLSGYPLSTLDPLVGMTRLRSMAVRRAGALMSLGGIASLPNLLSFELSDCDEPCDLDPLAACSRLEELTLLRCRYVSDLPPLSRAPLRRVRLMLPELAALGGLGAAPDLDWLAIDGCESLADLDDLADATRLAVLKARDCTDLSSLSGLERAEQLVWIDLCGCSAPSSELAALEQLPALVRLELSGELALAAKTRPHLLPKLQIARPPPRREHVPLGEYRIRRVLGQGGMGRVVEMEHGARGYFAVKAPLPHLLTSVEAFVAEARAWIDLGIHPNIVSCFYVRTIDGVPHAFAELIHGFSLAQHIQRRSLYVKSELEVLARILDIAIQIAWGMAYAHANGLVHQDLKPGNVMVTTDWFQFLFADAKVTDFGLARASSRAATSDADPTVTRLGLTPAYASPEQLLGRRLTRASDVWSWGLTVLEMFTRGLTWSQGPAGPRALQALESQSTTPRLPAQVAALLRRCFLVEPTERPTMELAADTLVDVFGAVFGRYHRSRPRPADQHADSLNNRAVSLLELGDEPAARAALEQALRLEPNHLEASFNAALIALRNREITGDEAVKRVRVSGDSSARAERQRAFIRREARQRPGDSHLRAPYALVRPARRALGRERAAKSHASSAMEALARDDIAAAIAAVERGRAAALASPDGLDFSEAADLAPARRALLRRCGRGAFSGESRAYVEQHTIDRVSLSEDGELALLSDGKLAWLYDVARQASAVVLPPAEPTTAVALSRDGHYMAVGHADGTLQIHVRAGTFRNESRVIIEHRAEGPVRWIGFDASGRCCIAAWLSGDIACIDLLNLRVRWTTRGPAVSEMAIAWTGRVGASIDDSGSLVTIYDLRDGRLAARSRLKAIAKQVAIAPDARHAWLRSDGCISTIDMATGDVIHVDAIASTGRIGVAVDGVMLVPGASEHRLLDFATADRRCLGVIPARGSHSVMAMSADATMVTLTDERGRADHFRLDWSTAPRARARWHESALPWLSAFEAAFSEPSSEDLDVLMSELALAGLGWLDRAGVEERLTRARGS